MLEREEEEEVETIRYINNLSLYTTYLHNVLFIQSTGTNPSVISSHVHYHYHHLRLYSFAITHIVNIS